MGICCEMCWWCRIMGTQVGRSVDNYSPSAYIVLFNTVEARMKKGSSYINTSLISFAPEGKTCSGSGKMSYHLVLLGNQWTAGMDCLFLSCCTSRSRKTYPMQMKNPKYKMILWSVFIGICYHWEFDDNNPF